MPLITYLTKIQFDFGALALLPEEPAARGVALAAAGVMTVLTLAIVGRNSPLAA